MNTIWSPLVLCGHSGFYTDALSETVAVVVQINFPPSPPPPPKNDVDGTRKQH